MYFDGSGGKKGRHAGRIKTNEELKRLSKVYIRKQFYFKILDFPIALMHNYKNLHKNNPLCLTSEAVNVSKSVTDSMFKKRERI